MITDILEKCAVIGIGGEGSLGFLLSKHLWEQHGARRLYFYNRQTGAARIQSLINDYLKKARKPESGELLTYGTIRQIVNDTNIIFLTFENTFGASKNYGTPPTRFELFNGNIDSIAKYAYELGSRKYKGRVVIFTNQVDLNTHYFCQEFKKAEGKLEDGKVMGYSDIDSWRWRDLLKDAIHKHCTITDREIKPDHVEAYIYGEHSPNSVYFPEQMFFTSGKDRYCVADFPELVEQLEAYKRELDEKGIQLLRRLGSSNGQTMMAVDEFLTKMKQGQGTIVMSHPYNRSIPDFNEKTRKTVKRFRDRPSTGVKIILGEKDGKLTTRLDHSPFEEAEKIGYARHVDCIDKTEALITHIDRTPDMRLPEYTAFAFYASSGTCYRINLRNNHIDIVSGLGKKFEIAASLEEKVALTYDEGFILIDPFSLQKITKVKLLDKEKLIEERARLQFTGVSPFHTIIQYGLTLYASNPSQGLVEIDISSIRNEDTNQFTKSRVGKRETYERFGLKKIAVHEGRVIGLVDLQSQSGIYDPKTNQRIIEGKISDFYIKDDRIYTVEGNKVETPAGVITFDSQVKQVIDCQIYGKQTIVARTQKGITIRYEERELDIAGKMTSMTVFTTKKYEAEITEQGPKIIEEDRHHILYTVTDKNRNKGEVYRADITTDGNKLTHTLETVARIGMTKGGCVLP